MDKLLQIMDFVQSCGSIHFHLLGYLGEFLGRTAPKTNKLVSVWVSDLTDAVNYSVVDISHLINKNYIPSDKFK